VSEQFEVAVVGGGLAGACAAALLTRHAGIAASRIALLAAQLPAPVSPNAAPELRVAAISRASERVLRAARANPRRRSWSRKGTCKPSLAARRPPAKVLSLA